MAIGGVALTAAVVERVADVCIRVINDTIARHTVLPRGTARRTDVIEGADRSVAERAGGARLDRVLRWAGHFIATDAGFFVAGFVTDKTSAIGTGTRRRTFVGTLARWLIVEARLQFAAGGDQDRAKEREKDPRERRDPKD